MTYILPLVDTIDYLRLRKGHFSRAGRRSSHAPFIVDGECTNSDNANNVRIARLKSPSESPQQIVSRTFHPDALINGFPPDKMLVSSDDMQFFVHSFILSTTSRDTIQVEDDSVVLNIILHTLYNISCAPFQPSLGSLGRALDRLVFYGMEPTMYIVPPKTTFDVLASHAPYLPLELYTLAARFDLYDLALVASSHLLSLKLSSLSDEVCSRMGARYLLRLFRMHIDRLSALKDLVLVPPNLHPETSSCRARHQEAMIGEWSIVVAYLSRDASPGTFV